MSAVTSTIIPRTQIAETVRRIRRQGAGRGKRASIVFTNGVFDIIHAGHVDYLVRAKRLGGYLIVGVNSDSSVRRLKGDGRPLQSERDRAKIVAALKPVDAVVLFSEDTPENLIELIRPDILAKGADYKLAEIVGAMFVRSYGGKVKRIALTRGRSTTALLRRMA
ncbi:MAG: D-glycero-beta-D-manno-heptose 1-phosphate adenylyltransferase [candidate division Zixibacteria bacterium]|nr:D-glycero-beta-D-manno-heptose 1-phosphate adenylyltransferase [candidate division Zixibacteria bacterium]